MRHLRNIFNLGIKELPQISQIQRFRERSAGDSQKMTGRVNLADPTSWTFQQMCIRDSLPTGRCRFRYRRPLAGGPPGDSATERRFTCLLYTSGKRRARAEALPVRDERRHVAAHDDCDGGAVRITVYHRR